MVTVEKREMIQLSGVIPCFNAAATLRVQLDALVLQQWDRPWEVLVADNGSLGWLKKDFG